MSEWKEYRLGDVIIYKKGFAFKSKDYRQTGRMIIRVSDTTENSIDISSCVFINETDCAGLNDYQLATDDIIIATVGSWPENPQSVVGKVVKVPKIADNALLNQNAVRLRGNELISQLYLYYLLKCSQFSFYIINNAQGSANQASITLDDIFSYKFLLPPLPEQRAIAGVLSSLDDKIDLLHRQNKTLEAMAETLFRQWFVEEASEGSRDATLGDFADNIRVNAKVEDLRTHDHYVGLEHIPRKSIALTCWDSTETLESNKSVFEKNDILFGKLRSYFHKVVFAPVRGVCSTDILVIRPKHPEWFSYCLFWFFNESVV